VREKEKRHRGTVGWKGKEMAKKKKGKAERRLN